MFTDGPAPANEESQWSKKVEGERLSIIRERLSIIGESYRVSVEKLHIQAL